MLDQTVRSIVLIYIIYRRNLRIGSFSLYFSGSCIPVQPKLSYNSHYDYDYSAHSSLRLFSDRLHQVLRLFILPTKLRLFMFTTMDHLHYRLNFDLNKFRQKFHHSLKEHHKISNIPKFRCEML
jgi:hypothetical protein